jgi:hypothetical protein
MCLRPAITATGKEATRITWHRVLYASVVPEIEANVIAMVCRKMEMMFSLHLRI